MTRPAGALDQAIRAPVCSACWSDAQGVTHEAVLRELGADDRAIEGLRALVAGAAVAVAPDQRSIDPGGAR